MSMLKAGVSIAFLAGFFSIMSTAAFAKDLDPASLAMLKDNFMKADKDADGKLTHAECNAGMPRIARGFDKIDSQKKGYITLDEILAFVASR